MHAAELQLIHWIHGFRSPFLDVFFKGLNFFDTPEFFFVLLPIIWLGHGWRAGLKLFYVLLLSSLINNVLKEAIMWPRPFHVDPSLAVIKVKSYGFPSGAAQTALLLSGLLWSRYRGFWLGVGAVAYTLLISFSRVYLGVHFPTDLVGGWLLGSALLLLYFYGQPRLERRLEQMSPRACLVWSQGVPLLLLLGFYSPPVIRICGVAMGLGLGVYIVQSYSWFPGLPKSVREYVLRGVIGVGGTFACSAMVHAIPVPNASLHLFFGFFILGLWLSLVSPLLCRALLNRRGICA